MIITCVGGIKLNWFSMRQFKMQLENEIITNSNNQTKKDLKIYSIVLKENYSDIYYFYKEFMT